MLFMVSRLSPWLRRSAAQAPTAGSAHDRLILKLGLPSRVREEPQPHLVRTPAPS